MRKGIRRVLAAMCAALVLCGCSPRQQRFETSFMGCFDTFTSVVSYGQDEDVFNAGVQVFRRELETCHRLFDIYNDYDGVNNLKTINDNAGVAPVSVDGRIIELLLFAKQVHSLTGGRVNVAMGSVLSLWHDYRTAGLGDPAAAQLPPMDALQAAAQHTDIDALIIDEQAGTVYLADPNMRLDVGAVAKGFAVQRACNLAEEQTQARFLVSVGGNVCAVGDRDENGTPWRVGLQDPYGGSDYLHTVAVTDGMSVVTSGNYQRYYTVDGRIYHHIIHPDTLMPADTFDAVTVICADSAMGDALSTALFNMTLEEGKALLETIEGAEAVWVADGEMFYSDGFAALITE